MTENSNGSQWKNKIHGMLQSAGSELKRTTAIGIKMLSASQATTQMHEKFEELGKLTYEAINSGALDWNNEAVENLLVQISKLQETLETYEEDVQHIKNSG